MYHMNLISSFIKLAKLWKLLRVCLKNNLVRLVRIFSMKKPKGAEQIKKEFQIMKGLEAKSEYLSILQNCSE